ncbi:MAG TPA: GNAT family N-acetyltransferase [Candidatus Limnocylindrales bacterium]|jgi:ribosomal protein S18 acetylase RimI-like enzyme|nr:GNAT family N-acetyltransferase [Candidatus Limnocylindrales bacterium]
MPLPVDAATHRRLLRHEAQVHAIPGRELRDLGDSLLLHDADDPEPFWNRIEAIRWPAAPAAFDRRLAEVAVLFAAIGRQPHAWLSPPHDQPADLAARLVANGFEDMGQGLLMVADDDARARSALAVSPLRDGVRLERFTALSGDAAASAADSIAGVLVAAFLVGDARRSSLGLETQLSLADPRFTHYLVRQDDRPVAVARRATFDGLSYLSSIGTLPEARGHGYGRFVTATALVDARAAGSEWVHLGVFADNAPARLLYERLGFVVSGEPGPDMVLTG